jgi:hypothetical protein
LFALLHLVMVSVAPLADAALEAKQQRSLVSVITAEGTADSSGGAHQHENCLFCNTVRGGGEKSPQFAISLPTAVTPSVVAATNSNPAGRQFLSVAHSRAPPVLPVSGI